MNFNTDVTDELKWMLSKASQQLQIPLIFVSNVTARDELVQKCLCLEVQHESHNVEQSLRRVTQRNGLNMPEACLSIAIACGHDVCKAINAAQLMGQRSSSSELPTANLSAPAACHQLLLPDNATDVPESLSCRSRTTSLSVERALKSWTNARLQLRSWHLEMWLSALRVPQRGLKTRPIPPRTSSILALFRH